MLADSAKFSLWAIFSRLLLLLVFLRFPRHSKWNAKLSFDLIQRWCRRDRSTNKYIESHTLQAHRRPREINFGRGWCMHQSCARMRINRTTKFKSIDFASKSCIQMHRTVCSALSIKWRGEELQAKKNCENMLCARQSARVPIARMHRARTYDEQTSAELQQKPFNFFFKIAMGLHFAYSTPRIHQLPTAPLSSIWSRRPCTIASKRKSLRVSSMNWKIAREKNYSEDENGSFGRGTWFFCFA